MNDGEKLTGFNLVNLENMVDTIGEDEVKSVLSEFSCPKNPEVEGYLRHKAIEFSRQGLASTHLVVTSFKSDPVIVGYFALAQKSIEISGTRVGSNLKRRIAKFGSFDPEAKSYRVSAALIAQLGKNCINGYNKLITGRELLQLAVNKIKAVQLDIGGRIIYLECEDVEPLNEFYNNFGFVDFGERLLDREEMKVMHGRVLKQKLMYVSR